jgi:SET domain-containing protein
MLPPSRHIQVGQSPRKGRGVYARGPITAGQLIERVPVLVLPAEQCAAIDQTLLYNYVYGWGLSGNSYALPLGMGCLYNHSYRPNARYAMDAEADTMDFLALRDIEAGEEIRVNYNGHPQDRSPLWFEVDPEPEPG